MIHYYRNQIKEEQNYIFVLCVNDNGNITMGYGLSVAGKIEDMAIEQFNEPYEIDAIERKMKFSRHGRYFDLQKSTKEEFEEVFQELTEHFQKIVS